MKTAVRCRNATWSRLPFAVLLASQVQACGPQFLPEAEADNASLKEIHAEGVRPVAGVTNTATALAEAKKLGYLPESGCGQWVKGGEQVMFSIGSTGQFEPGQASGLVVHQNGAYLLEQKAAWSKGNGLDAAIANAPGVAGLAGFTSDSLKTALSSWNIPAFLETICNIAFARINSSPYEKVDAALVDMTGGTAGLELGEKDALRLTLSRGNLGTLGSELAVYFKKGVGPFAFNYLQASNLPAFGTSTNRLAFQFFIDGAGGSGIGSGPTESAEFKVLHDKCTTLGGELQRNGTSAECGVKTMIPDVSSQADCTSKGGEFFYEPNFCWDVQEIALE